MQRIDATTTSEPRLAVAAVGDESGPKVKTVEDLLRLLARMLAIRHRRQNAVTPLCTGTRDGHQASLSVTVREGSPRPDIMDSQKVAQLQGDREAAVLFPKKRGALQFVGRYEILSAG